MFKAHAHAVLAGDAVLRSAVGLNHPRAEGFPGHKQRLGSPGGGKTDFAPLPVEAGGDDFGEVFMGFEPDEKAHGGYEKPHHYGYGPAKQENVLYYFPDQIGRKVVQDCQKSADHRETKSDETGKRKWRSQPQLLRGHIGFTAPKV